MVAPYLECQHGTLLIGTGLFPNRIIIDKAALPEQPKWREIVGY